MADDSVRSKRGILANASVVAGVIIVAGMSKVVGIKDVDMFCCIVVLSGLIIA